MDFRNASRLFADPDFDGEPVSVIDVDPGDEFPKDEDDKPLKLSYPDDDERMHFIDDGDDIWVKSKRPVYRVSNVPVKILSERVQYYDKDGKLVTESLTDYSKRNILGKYATLDSFLTAWNREDRKQAIVDALKDEGVLLDALREIAGNKDLDDFDLICHIAYDAPALTKAERANNVRKRGYLYQYSDLAQKVLDALLDKYMTDGIAEIENIEILSNDPFRQFGSPLKIAKALWRQSWLSTSCPRSAKSNLYRIRRTY